MADFGPVLYGLTKFKKENVLYESIRHVGYTYAFTVKKKCTTGEMKSFWQCGGCQKLKNKDKTLGKVPIVVVQNDMLLTDPDYPKNDHFCEPRLSTAVLAEQYRHNITAEVEVTGKLPHQAFTEGLAQAAREVADVGYEERDAVQLAMPKWKSLKPALYRAHNKKFPIIRGVNSIPENLKLTLLGTTARSPEDPHYQEGYFILQQENPAFIVVGSPQDLEVLHQSRHWVMDGTFKYCPKEFGISQLYVIFGFVSGESVAAIHALMPNRQRVSYDLLFTTVRNALVQRFGTVGVLSCGHFDFECAALGAFKGVFQEAEAKGCAFHFAQAINRKIGELGFKPVYDRSPAQGYDAPQYAVVHTWVRRVVGLCILHPGYVRPYFDRVLQIPPHVGDEFIAHSLGQFSRYVETYWLKSPDQIALLNHFDNDGPRTNNNAEGYNSSLSSKFRQPSQKLSHFLVHFQEQHHETSLRAARLLEGGPPEPKIARYVENNGAIAEAKQRFRWNVARILRQQDFISDLDVEITAYLDYVQQFLG